MKGKKYVQRPANVFAKKNTYTENESLSHKNHMKQKANDTVISQVSYKNSYFKYIIK